MSSHLFWFTVANTLKGANTNASDTWTLYNYANEDLVYYEHYFVKSTLPAYKKKERHTFAGMALFIVLLIINSQ